MTVQSTNADNPFDLLPPAGVADAYRDKGWWRDTSILHDLVSAAAADPARPAIVSYRSETARTVTVRYGELLRYVQRFAGALTALGIRRGDAVAFQLPSWWETTVLTLSCMWVGAVAVPIHTSVGARELEMTLTEARARLAVVPATWQGTDHALQLEKIAGRLPLLRHRVVYGESAGVGTIDFAAHFLDTAHEDTHTLPPLPTGQEMDRARLLMFTSGTTGRRKSVVHTENTLYAGIGAAADPVERGWADGEVFGVPHPITGLAGLLYVVWGPILARGTGVYSDVWEPGRLLDLVEAAGVTQVFAAPAFLAQLADAQEERQRDLTSLRFVMAGAAPVRPELVERLATTLSVQVRACWGMTEVGLGIRTREDDPPGWAAHSDGKPLPGLEVDLRPVPETEGVHRLWVRGPSVCTALWRSGDAASIVGDTDNGWLDTGDLVRGDGRGGMRLVGRASRRIGNEYMIPVEEVEKELARHPSVREVAVIGYTDPEQGERPCAVVVPNGPPPTLAQLREYLTGQGMTTWYLPTRLLEVDTLPHNENGKVAYDDLHAMLTYADAG